jgi:Tol biopolymer transport system component
MIEYLTDRPRQNFFSHQKFIEMKAFSIKTITGRIVAFSFLLISCQKEVSHNPDDQSIPASTMSSSINKDKKDRSILFVSNRDGNDEIYAMNEDGTNIVRLTYNTVPDGRASWSANGQLIAFASGQPGSRDIYVMNANGHGLRNITNTPNADEDWPEWSPKSNKVIFSSNRDGNHEIYLTDLDQEEVVRLTFRSQDDKWPSFSPDGEKIAFQSNLGGTAGTDVFTMDVDGSNVTQLTFANALDQMPTWSPDGSQIAFLSSRDGNPEVYVMNADGTNQTRLTNTPAIDARPCWSRETGKIVFTSGRDFSLPSTNPKFEIYIMNSDGTGATRLTNNNVYDDYPFIK